jgi:hypothetical protein
VKCESRYICFGYISFASFLHHYGKDPSTRAGPNKNQQVDQTESGTSTNVDLSTYLHIWSLNLWSRGYVKLSEKPSHGINLGFSKQAIVQQVGTLNLGKRNESATHFAWASVLQPSYGFCGRKFQQFVQPNQFIFTASHFSKITIK